MFNPKIRTILANRLRHFRKDDICPGCGGSGKSGPFRCPECGGSGRG